MRELQPGTILVNRYRIARQISRGGFGIVYRAWDLKSNQAVALKQNLDNSPQVVAQFQREAEILVKLKHPNFPRVFDWFQDQGSSFLVMEFIDVLFKAMSLMKDGRYTDIQDYDHAMLAALPIRLNARQIVRSPVSPVHPRPAPPVTPVQRANSAKLPFAIPDARLAFVNAPAHPQPDLFSGAACWDLGSNLKTNPLARVKVEPGANLYD